MGRKQRAYEAALTVESIARDNYNRSHTEENTNNAMQAERNTELLRAEYQEDPEG